MNNNILERIAQINKELEEIKKEEENDMKENNVSKIIDRDVEEFLKDIESPIDFDIFNEYRRITNEHKGHIEDLFKQLTPEGIMKTTETLVRVYVYKVWNDEDLYVTDNEIRNLAYMGMMTCTYAPNNLKLQNYIMAIIQTYEMAKGGVR